MDHVLKHEHARRMFLGLAYDQSMLLTSLNPDAVVAEGDLRVVQWCHEYALTSDRFTTKAMDVAAENGHLDMVRWLRACDA